MTTPPHTPVIRAKCIATLKPGPVGHAAGELSCLYRESVLTHQLHHVQEVNISGPPFPARTPRGQVLNQLTIGTGNQPRPRLQLLFPF